MNGGGGGGDHHHQLHGEAKARANGKVEMFEFQSLEMTCKKGDFPPNHLCTYVVVLTLDQTSLKEFERIHLVDVLIILSNFPHIQVGV